MGHLSTPGPDTGFFSTSEASAGIPRAPNDKRFSRAIRLSKGQSGRALCVRTGINALDCDASRGDNIRFSAGIENVTPDSFDVVGQTWNNSILNDATLTWIEHKEDAKDVQTGWWQQFLSGNNTTQRGVTNRVTFNTPFDEPPVVVLWLHYLDLRSNSQWRIHTYATGVSRDAFTINIESWNTSQIYKAGVTWIAYKQGKLDIDSGKFAADSQRGQRQPHKTREIAFSSGKFVTPPTIFSGLSMIDHTSSKPLKIASVANNVTAKGFTWSLDTETEWTCSAEYIAIGQTPLASGGESNPGAEMATQVEIKDDKEIHAQRDDWIVQRARSLEQLRASLSEWEDNLKKRESTIGKANAQRTTAVEERESAAKEREAALIQREEAIKQKESVSSTSREPAAMPNGVGGQVDREATIQQLQQEVGQLKLQLTEAASKRAPMRPSRATADDGEEDTVESALPRPPIQPPARELPAGNLDWGFDPDLLARFNQGMAGRNLMRPSRREREEGSVW